MRSLRNEEEWEKRKKRDEERKDRCKSFFSERNGEKKSNAAESGIHIMD